MILVPLPFVVAFLLAIVLLQMYRRNAEGVRQNPFFIALIAAYALQSVLLGIRWGYGHTELLPAQGFVAGAVACLAWVSFKNLTREQPGIAWREILPHALPALAIGALALFWRDVVGPAITITFVAYGVALVLLARKGPDGLVATRLDGAMLSYRSLQITAAALIISAAMDVVISSDMMLSGGRYSGAIVAVGNMISLVVLAAAASVAGSGEAVEEAEDAREPASARLRSPQENEEVMAALAELMQAKRLYRDTELNLGRIARRLNLPARHISMAVNRIHGISVSQYVNNCRVEEACHLLATTEDAVIQVALACGFLSKSNFNREFLRVTGSTPTDWRRRAGREDITALRVRPAPAGRVPEPAVAEAKIAAR